MSGSLTSFPRSLLFQEFARAPPQSTSLSGCGVQSASRTAAQRTKEGRGTVARLVRRRRVSEEREAIATAVQLAETGREGATRRIRESRPEERGTSDPSRSRGLSRSGPGTGENPRREAGNSSPSGMLSKEGRPIISLAGPISRGRIQQTSLRDLSGSVRRLGTGILAKSERLQKQKADVAFVPAFTSPRRGRSCKMLAVRSPTATVSIGRVRGQSSERLGQRAISMQASPSLSTKT